MKKAELQKALEHFNDDADVAVLIAGRHYEDSVALADVYELNDKYGNKAVILVMED